MLAWILLLPAIYLAALAETTLASAAALGPVQPLALAPLAALWLLARRQTYGFLVAGLLGLVVDLLSPGLFGLSTATFLLAGFGFTFFLHNWASRLLPVRLAWTFFFVWVVAQVDAVAAMLQTATASWEASLIWLPLAVAGYSTALTVPIWMLCSWWQENPADQPAPSTSDAPPLPVTESPELLEESNLKPLRVSLPSADFVAS